MLTYIIHYAVFTHISHIHTSYTSQQYHIYVYIYTVYMKSPWNAYIWLDSYTLILLIIYIHIRDIYYCSMCTIHKRILHNYDLLLLD